MSTHNVWCVYSKINECVNENEVIHDKDIFNIVEQRRVCYNIIPALTYTHTHTHYKLKEVVGFLFGFV